MDQKPAVLILRMRKVLSLDATSLYALEDVVQQTQREGTALLLSGVHAQPLVVMQRSGLLDRVGEDNVLGDIDDALQRAREVLDQADVNRPVHPQHAGVA